MTWGDKARVVIGRVLATLPNDATEADAERALSDAYPFGERAMHPYKAWLKAVNAALVGRYPHGRRARLATQQQRLQARRKHLREQAIADGAEPTLFD